MDRVARENSTQNRYLALDAIRGLSALAVCAGHLRAVLLPDYASLQHSRAILAPLYFVTSLGHQAVLVFFVLSGFLVGGSVLRDPAAFSLGRYAVARLTRLWTVLLPALLFTAAIDSLTRGIDPNVLAGSRYLEWSSGPTQTQPAALGWITAVGNLLFLQTIYVPVFGTNSPLWSLANEFWYYVLFPLLLWASGKTGARREQRVAATCAAVTILAWLPGEIAVGFAYWSLGIIAWCATRKLSDGKLNWLRWCAATLFLTALALKGALGAASNPLVAATFALFLSTISTSRIPGGRSTALISHAMAEISYSLYCFHFPMVVLLGASILQHPPQHADIFAIAAFLGELVGIVLVSSIMWWLFERHTGRIRQFILRSFSLNTQRTLN